MAAAQSGSGAAFALLTAALLIAAAMSRALPSWGAAQRLVVCADPNNLPFSDRAGQGLENKLAQLLAKDMGARLEYVWWAQRRGYLRSTLSESKCDLWPGVASGVTAVSTTRPYYASTYVFVTRADRHLAGLTLDDPRLKSLKIGVQMIGNNAANTPPAHALAVRGLIDNVRGFMLYGDYDRPNPPAEIIHAVERGQIDVALVWGPLAGYFASLAATPLQLQPVSPHFDGPQWPMVYSIAVGVRPGDTQLRAQLDAILEREQPRIQALLRAYHVPQVAALDGAPQVAARP